MAFSFSSDTICALSTPEGYGALSVIRISGDAAFLICEKIFIPAGKNKSLTDRAYPCVVFGKVLDGFQILDEAVLTLFKAPASFTGEDTAEFSLHGSPYIRKRVLELLIENTCIPFTESDFTKRVFMRRNPNYFKLKL